MAHLTREVQEAAIRAVGKHVETLFAALIVEMETGQLSWPEVKVGLFYQLGGKVVDDFRTFVLDTPYAHLIGDN